MTVVVSFIKPKGMLTSDTPGVGSVRVRENLAIGGTTTASAKDGEVVIIGNAETSMVAIAFGSTPDADALESSGVTSAGYPIPSGATSDPLVVSVGDKINVESVA